MLKIIRDFIPQPMFMILCDRSCGVFAHIAIEQGPQVSEDAQQSVWARSLIQNGWKITLAEHVCPQHVQQAAAARSMIIVPGLAGIGSAGRN